LFQHRRAKFVVAYRTDNFLVLRLNNLIMAVYPPNLIWASAGQKIIKNKRQGEKKETDQTPFSLWRDPLYLKDCRLVPPAQ
jgi:hypothetical protein